MTSPHGIQPAPPRITGRASGVSLCPVDRCRNVRVGDMCRMHWKLLPSQTRTTLWSAKRAWLADQTNPLKLKAFRAASADAVAAAALLEAF
jgi:hypothetical protein